jgi:hypothetical protein
MVIFCVSGTSCRLAVLCSYFCAFITRDESGSMLLIFNVKSERIDGKGEFGGVGTGFDFITCGYY